MQDKTNFSTQINAFKDVRLKRDKTYTIKSLPLLTNNVRAIDLNWANVIMF